MSVRHIHVVPSFLLFFRRAPISRFKQSFYLSTNYLIAAFPPLQSRFIYIQLFCDLYAAIASITLSHTHTCDALPFKTLFSLYRFVCLSVYFCITWFITEHIFVLTEFVQRQATNIGVNQYLRVVKIFESLNQLTVVYWLPSIKCSNPCLTVAIFMDPPSSSILVLVYSNNLFDYN